MDSRAVLVTGANSGIGLATLLEVAGRGFRAVGTVRSPAKGRAVREAARARGLEVSTAILDVTDAEGCRRVADRVRPWGLVNNAGTSFTGAIEDVDDEQGQAALDTMVVAPMRLARLSLPHMRAQEGGRIVNVSSIYGLATTPLTGWYQGAKHALEALTDALRMEVASDGIGVSLVEPGSFDTGIWSEAESEMEGRRGSRYETAYRRSLSQVRMSRPIRGAPERVARVIATALTSRSPRARYLVGADARLFALAERVAPTMVSDRVKRLVLGL